MKELLLAVMGKNRKISDLFEIITEEGKLQISYPGGGMKYNINVNSTMHFKECFNCFV